MSPLHIALHRTERIAYTAQPPPIATTPRLTFISRVGSVTRAFYKLPFLLKTINCSLLAVHAPGLQVVEMANEKKDAKGTKLAVMNKYVYDAFLWTFSILVELFFREVHPRSSWKVPKEGPVIFVCAPHANQVGNIEHGSWTTPMLTTYSLWILSC